MLVGAAGMLVELLSRRARAVRLAAVEPGLVRAIAYNVMLIAGVSTLVFNGNPLLRFDGYYILADLIEIPNLGQRANQLPRLPVPALHPRHAATPSHPRIRRGERVWLVVYGIASFLYRMFVTFAIVLFIAGQFFVIGVLLAIWAVATQVLMPIGKSLSFLLGHSHGCGASAGGRWRPASAHRGGRGLPALLFAAGCRAGRAPKASSGCPRKRRCGPAPTASSSGC